MLNSISTMNNYYSMYRYGTTYGNSPVRGTQTAGLQNIGQAVSAWEADAVSGSTQAKTSVPESSRPASYSGGRLYLSMPGGENSPADFMQADPAELAVRMRIQYLDPESASTELSELSEEAKGISESEDSKMIGEEEKCQTCEQRKYQDGSDDMGVSFKTPTRIAPEAAAAAVRGHEQEHVVREQAKAKREGRRVVSQNVTLHTEICPECGKPYISGGTTKTVTAAEPENQTAESFGAADSGQTQADRTPFAAVA